MLQSELSELSELTELPLDQFIPERWRCYIIFESKWHADILTTFYCS